MSETRVLQRIPGLSLKRLPVQEAPGSPTAPDPSSSCIKGVAKGEGVEKRRRQGSLPGTARASQLSAGRGLGPHVEALVLTLPALCVCFEGSCPHHTAA